MKKIVFMAIMALVFSTVASAQLYSTATAKVGFFSKTALEDIEAQSNTALAVLNTSTRELAFSITNTSFAFKNKLMEEHFNEKYMESDKYPKSSFKGKINEAIDFSKDGSYDVTVTGKLNIHGVEVDRTISGKIIIKDGKIQLLSTFKVKNADHKIEIPTVVTEKISEELEVKVDALLAPRK